MRIQHNIMAMNAYRNYNTNTSALSKNLEKLSSGYKINRAGDDAAGLAISEKMRAQITGLNAAQKNVKDGISLVKTAEGAMQEIQDMLNRMDYLATQSANGTYDNEVDRANLQKEVEALQKEINRIADSANFNGIKLLDGSLDPTAIKGGTPAQAEVKATEGYFELPEVNPTLGTDTILHSGGGTATKTKFSVDLHNVAFTNKTGESMKITLGEGTSKTEIVISAGAINSKNANTAVTAADIATEIAAGNSGQVKINGKAGTTPNKITIDGETFSVTATGGTLTFEQDAVTTKNINGDMAVKVEGVASEEVKAGWTTGAYVAGTNAETSSGMKDDAKVKVTLTVPTGTNGVDEDLDFEAAGLGNNATAGDIVNALKDLTESGTDGTSIKLGDVYDISADKDGKITLALKADQTVVGSATVKSFTYTADTGTAVTGDTKATWADTGAATAAKEAGDDPVTGDWNVKTTNTTTGKEASKATLASTVITLDSDKFTAGSKFKFGDGEVEVSDAAADKTSTTKVYVGDLDLTKADDMKTAIDRLTVAAANCTKNDVWTVGYDGNADYKVTVVEKVGTDGTTSYMDGTSPKYDLTVKEGTADKPGIRESLGYVTAGKAAVAASGGTAGKELVLQIGDTSDPFNQMKIGVGDMHVEAMFGLERNEDGTLKKDASGNTIKTTKSIANISIADRESASDAVNVIKDAINYVSSVRGDLGAIQNRLEHTANNLSVMAENIQDAESTIRDTDVAEEMMAYTKNNILIQSAQAMLAQANAVPQGVLQLLG